MNPSQTLSKFYLLSDEKTAWTFSVDEDTTCEQILTQVAKKLKIDKPSILELYACYTTEEGGKEEQDRMALDSSLFHIREELNLERKAKFRFGIRMPVEPVRVSTPPIVPNALDSTINGYLYKKGNGVRVVPWRRRWFCREGDRLYYYRTKDDKEPINYIDLSIVSAIPVNNNNNSSRSNPASPRGTPKKNTLKSNENESFSNDDNENEIIEELKIDKKGKSKEDLFFNLKTDVRIYKLRAETLQDKNRWITHINDLLTHRLVEERQKQNISKRSRKLRPVEGEALTLRSRARLSSKDKPVPKLPPKNKAKKAEAVPILPKKDKIDYMLKLEESMQTSQRFTLPRDSLDRLSAMIEMIEQMDDEDAKKLCTDAVGEATRTAEESEKLIQKLTSDLADATNIISMLTEEKNLNAPPGAERFTILRDPQRFFDRTYVERLEKEFMDTREELEEMKAVFEGVEAVKNALDQVLMKDADTAEKVEDSSIAANVVETNDEEEKNVDDNDGEKKDSDNQEEIDDQKKESDEKLEKYLDYDV